MAAKSLALQVGVAPTCRALGVPRATFYRRHSFAPGRQQPRSTPARALCEGERERVLETLSSPRFVDRAPARGRRDASGRRAVPLLGTHDVSDSGCERAGARTTKSAHSPELHQARAGRDRTERNLVMGYHAPSGAENAGRTFTCTCCSTSSADMWSGGWSPNGRTRRWPHGSSSKPASSKASSPRR